MSDDKHMESPATKICYKCGEAKPATREFWYGDKRAKDGLKFECKACFNQMGKRWAQNNKDKVNARSQRWRDANREKFREANRRSHFKYRKKYYAKHLEWRKKNPERYRELQRTAQRNYKARKRGAEGTHTADDIEQIFEQQRGRCALCRKKLGNDRHVDHIIPLTAGGTNWPSNLQITHGDCNSAKHSTDQIEFMQRRGFLL